MDKSKLFEFDEQLGVNGFVCGCDEAGAGPLAGPLVCAAVIMPYEQCIMDINDSKKLSEKKRNNLYEQIINTAIAYSVATIEPKEIDQINIYNARKKGMENAINMLKIVPQLALVDAMKDLNISMPQRAIIKGDQTSYCIAAASIIAKVFRDKIMTDYSVQFPQYYLHQHKGYGTKLHMEMIKKFGACSIHRQSFLKKLNSMHDKDLQEEEQS